MFRSPDFNRIALKVKRIIVLCGFLNSPNRLSAVFLLLGKGRGVMKRFLLISGFVLLFAAQVQALSCGPGTYLAVSTCGSGMEQCNLCPSGCSSCSGISGTSSCQYWDQEQGKVITTTATSTYGSCNSCDSGYELKKYTSGGVPLYLCERETITCPSNCSSCSSSSTCTACKSGYTLKNGQCVKPCPANCAQCDSSGVCTKCNSGYKLKDGACEAGSVISCPDDMKLSADGCCCMPN